MGSIRIEIANIREGSNRFRFRVGPEEIGLEEEGAVYRKPLEVDLEITRSGVTLRLRGEVRSEVERTCGRCLVPFSEVVDAPFEEALKVDGDGARLIDVDYEGDPGFLPGPPGSFVLDEIVREVVLVAAPMQPVCRPDCRGLCVVCGADRNKGECGCQAGEGHEAWRALRGLYRKTEKRD